MERGNLDFAWASDITLRSARAAFARSVSADLGTLGPINERRGRNSPNTSAEGTTLSGPSVSLHALRA